MTAVRRTAAKVICSFDLFLTKAHNTRFLRPNIINLHNIFANYCRTFQKKNGCFEWGTLRVRTPLNTKQLDRPKKVSLLSFCGHER